MDIKILYEDNHLIGVYKPAGVLVQAEDGAKDDNTLYWQIKEFIKKRDQKPGKVFLGVLHRLDRPTSGVVLFAKTSKGAARLSEQFRNRNLKKVYHCVVIGKLNQKSGTLRNFLIKDNDQKKAVISEVGDEAILHYQVIKSDQNSLLKIELETGRFHQIRAQLSATKHPIVGDIKYGAPEALSDKSIALCATSLEFKTATGNELKTIQIEIPAEWYKLL